MSKEKQIIVFFLYNKPGGMHEAGQEGPKRTSHVGGWREHFYLDKEQSGDTFWPIIIYKNWHK